MSLYFFFYLFFVNVFIDFLKLLFFFFCIFYRYLQEIGYTDTIIDVRSNRVRSLLGLNNNTESDELNTPALNGNDPSNKRTGERLTTTKKVEVNRSFLTELLLLIPAGVCIL